MNLRTLETGIRWVRTNKPTWKSDFSPAFYEEIYSQRPDRLDVRWWKLTVDRLWNWRAIRSPKPPNTKDAIFERGMARLPTIDQYYQSIRQSLGGEPSMDTVTWEDIAPLFQVLSDIKDSASPVFASKLGHFLFPRVFVVIDNEATAAFPYEFIWSVLQLAWREFPDKDSARQMLAAEMGRDIASVHPGFPFETKISELWLIGYRHG